MEILESLFAGFKDLIPTGTAVAGVAIILLAVRYVLNRKYAGASGRQFRLQLSMMILSLVGLIVVILALPVSEAVVGQLLSLLGILLSAAIALSASTFVGNIMGGLMQRAVGNFKPGDFISVGDHFGRVSERGLFHLEIQTEERDLTTLPHLYLVTNPVKVIQTSGTLVTAKVSLGYDIPRAEVKRCLLQAAENAGLQEPFLHIVELGDYSVTYRVAGMLTETKTLLSTRSRLKEQMLDELHRARIEIVSPTFMNQSVLSPDRKFIPATTPPETPDAPATKSQEQVVFDKADEAESVEKLRARHKEMATEIEVLREKAGQAVEDEKKLLESRIEALKTSQERLLERVKAREESQ